MEASPLGAIQSREWEWLGYHEIMGLRRRYRLLDLDQLCWRVQASTVDDLQKNLESSVEQMIACNELERTAYWTESIAVGSAEAIKAVKRVTFSPGERDGVRADVNTICGRARLRQPLRPRLALMTEASESTLALTLILSRREMETEQGRKVSVPAIGEKEIA